MQLEGPALVFWTETKIEGGRCWGMVNHMGFQNCITMNNDGLSGGLASFYSKDVLVSLNTQSKSHIDVTVTNMGSDQQVWRFTCLYRKLHQSERVSSWLLLNWLSHQSDVSSV